MTHFSNRSWVQMDKATPTGAMSGGLPHNGAHCAGAPISLRRLHVAVCRILLGHVCFAAAGGTLALRCCLTVAPVIAADGSMTLLTSGHKCLSAPDEGARLAARNGCVQTKVAAPERGAPQLIRNTEARKLRLQNDGNCVRSHGMFLVEI